MLLTKLFAKGLFWRPIPLPCQLRKLLQQQTARNVSLACISLIPAQLMKLVEVVSGYKTSDETVQELKELSKRLSKEPVEVKKDSPGFIVNRIMLPQFIEAIKLVQEGVASYEDIDKAVKLGLNYPMGPFELQDFAGVDIGYMLWSILKRNLMITHFAPPLLLKQLMRAGRFGKKAGAGFYDYE